MNGAINTTVNKASCTYIDLQIKMDALVGKLGLYESIRVLKNLIDNTSIKANEQDKIKLIRVYLISQCIKIFDLDEARFYTSSVREYREARRSCYYLMRKYTDCSDHKIAHDFKQSSHRMVIYHRQKCEEILSIPHSYKELIQKHQLLEEYLFDFMSKLPETYEK